MTPANRQELNALLRRHLLEADAARVAPWVLPAIGFRDGTLGDEPTKIGTTRFGGRPDLASDVQWPIGPEGPLAFLGQIAMSEIHPFDVDQVLPARGLLSFFFNIREYAWGTYPEDAAKFAVLFQPEGPTLSRREFPSGIHDDHRLARVRAVSPYLRWEVPTLDPLAQSAIGFGDCPTWMERARDKFTERYWNLEDELTKLHVPVGTHQLLGWASGMYHQGQDTRLICESARRGFPAEDSPEFADAVAGRADWRCLLQVSDDRDLYCDVWGDGGTIAFMIREEDLHRRNFAASWCVLST